MTGRQALFDDVYLAVPVSGARGWALRYRDIITLCRRLGLGLLAVKGAAVEALYQKSLAEQDEAKRKAIFNQMEDLMESSGGFIFICFEPYIALHDSTLNPVILADGQPDPVMLTKA